MATRSDAVTHRKIKQGELEAILALRLEVETLERQLKRAKEELDKSELLTMHGIETGRQIEPGELSAAINVQQGARRPKWKEEFATVAGPAAVERVIQSTPPGPETKKLVVSRGGQVVKAA